MANRRMLHKSISISASVNELDDFGKVLFSWMIPHADDWGRMPADPRVIKALVVPMIDDAGADRVKSELEQMDKLDLITLYVVDGKQYLQFPNWEKYQTGLGNRTTSRIPDNPSVSDNLSEVQIISALTKPNSTKPNLTEPNPTQPNFDDDDAPSVGARTHEMSDQQVYRAYQKRIAILQNPQDFIKVDKAVDVYGHESVIAAIEKAYGRDKAHWNYVVGILEGNGDKERPAPKPQVVQSPKPAPAPKVEESWGDKRRAERRVLALAYVEARQKQILERDPTADPKRAEWRATMEWEDGKRTLPSEGEDYEDRSNTN